MFKDKSEEDYFYFVAKAVAEEIAIQLDEIEDSEGVNTVDLTTVNVNPSESVIEVETTYLGNDSKRFSKLSKISESKPTLDFLPKVIYFWYKCFNEDFKEHGIVFSNYSS